MSKPAYLRDLPPIPDEEMQEVTKPETLSITFLQTFSNCPRSAFLARKYKNGAPSHPMIRGSFFHLVRESLTNTLIISDEPEIPGELAREVLADVLRAHPQWVLPPFEVDAVRGMVWNSVEHYTINVDEVFGVEQLWVLELDNGLVRGKMDLHLVGNGMSRVDDYKTSLAMKSQEDWEQDFQGLGYDLLTCFGHSEDGSTVPSSVRMFESNVVYPRYVFDGKIAMRTSYRDRLELQDHLSYLIDLVEKVHAAWDTGKFPAIPSDEQCGRCAARSECPIQQHLRGEGDGVLPIETHAEAAQYAEDRKFHQNTSKALTRELRKWVNDYGPVPYGKDQEIALEPRSQNNTDWPELDAAIQRSIELGEPFHRERYIKSSHSTNTVDRKREKESADG